MTTGTTAIRARALEVVRGGRRVLRGVDVDVAAGTVTGLLGPSGCGKTTFIRSVVGVQVVASGRIEVLGIPAGSPALRSRVAYVTQTSAVYDDLTVRENLTYFAAMLGAPASDVARVLHEVDLVSEADVLVGRLSGGQGNRASLATALLGRPELWCSTSRPWASTRCYDATCGRCSPARPRRHHAAGLEPRHGRGRTVRPSAPHARGHVPLGQHAARALERTGAPDVETAFLSLVEGDGSGSPA